MTKEWYAWDLIQAVAMLEPYSVAVRYPSDDADPTYEDAKMAASCMNIVNDWVKASADRFREERFRSE